jgi:hypothetical protein
VLDVGGRGGHGAHDRWVERPARARQEGEPGDAAEHLEPSRRQVLVRHRVAGGVRQQPEDERAPP